MTATTSATRVPPSGTVVHRVTFARVLHSEWIKLRTLRSTLWTVAITAVVMVGFALLVAALLSGAGEDPEMRRSMEQDPGLQAMGMTGTTIVTVGYAFGQLAIAVLAALVVTSEYSTGMVRSTFSAVPHRLPVLWAKLVVIAATTVVLIAATLGVAYLVTRPMLEEARLSVDLSEPDQLRAVLGCVLYLATVAAFSLAVGALMRHTAGSIFTLVALFFVLPIIFQIIVSTTDARWTDEVNMRLPSVAGERIISTATTPDTLLEPWTGYAVLAGYTVVLLVAAAVAIRRRDA